MSEAFPTGENQQNSEPDPADKKAIPDPYIIITEGTEPYTYTDDAGTEHIEPNVTPGQE